MKERKRFFKKSVLFIMALSMIIGASGAAIFGASADTATSQNAVSTFDDGYQLNANWIWADTPVKQGQWVSLRKTFTLENKPNEFIARISADTKYWLWVNGKQVIFEGQLKLGDSNTTWYYDKEDLSSYLLAGENTIAVQVFYSGVAGGSTINTTVPSFLFDAETESGLRVVSDTSWKAVLDPAYKEPISLNNTRNGEANIKYDVSSEMVDANGNKWTDKNYDDSAWAYAVNQDEKIKANVISGSDAYYHGVDPRRQLVLRSIPQLKLDEISKFTADGANGTGTWEKTKGTYTFAPLSLPEAYTVEAEIIVAEPSTSYSGGGSADAAIGLCVCVADVNNFYMPQISFTQGTSFNGVRFKPHTMLSGNWVDRSSDDLTNTELGKSLYVSGSHDNRFNTKHTVKIEVTADAVKTYLNGYLVGTIPGTTLAREGSSIGFRQDRNELINLYSLKVTDTSGTELYNAGISNLKSGDTAERFSLLKHKNTAVSTVYNTVATDASGKSYVAIRNCRTGVNDGNFYSTYVITNETNIQGTPYIKARSANGGELISMESDAWKKGNASSIAHQYITKAGEQSWEALGWMNGYKITFTIPDSVQVLELGFRKSGYDTEATGSVTTDNEILNQLYKEAFDTLYVCMRDSYMDCPDRERTQWWGDAVINMQQAAYALDEQAMLLYKKTLTQVIGFVEKNGALSSKVALGRPALELPMQSLAGVHSFWQYYMYYGDKALVVEAYPVLLNYLKLWGISESGVITHRDGDWNWYDWGNHPDTVILENCWYYEAMKAVLNIANLEGSGAAAADIEFLEGRMELIEKNFDTLYWNAEKNAYYNETDNGIVDDRANAMAIYTGLADVSRYDGILDVLVSVYNSGPYMEKYVLEAMYMMGADDEAVARTLDRFAPFTEDGYPTLPEIWADQTLYNGDETKNHAWTGSPLSLLYMYNAGITATSPAFETIQIKPQLGGLNSISATVERGSGKIIVNVVKTANKYTLDVNVPTGASSAVIYVPRIEGVDTMIKVSGATVFAGGTAMSTMPTGISYVGQDTDYVVFSVPSGAYSFTAEENTVYESSSYNVTINTVGVGAIKVNGVSVTLPHTVSVTRGGTITVTYTPDDKYRLLAITGSYPETVVSTTSVSRTYTVNSDMTINAVFEEKPFENRLINITSDDTDVARYAISVYVNDTLVSLPYTGSYPEGAVINVVAKGSGKKNYSVTINGTEAEEIDVTLLTNTSIVINATKLDTVSKKTISTVTPNDTYSNPNWKPDFLKDGIIISNTALGYTTGSNSSADRSANPYTLTFDLGSVQTINQVAMFPRFDSWTADSTLSANYPVDFTISVSEDGTAYNTVVTVKNGANPRFKQQSYSFAETEARYVKLTVTKLGIPAYNDGSNNDHYRLQLSEFEVYYNSALTPIETEYGTIPYDYIDESVYPIVVFKEDKTFVGAFNSWKSALDSVGLVEKTDNHGKGTNSVILFRDNYTHNASTGNIHSFYNNVTIDLGENTVTLSGQNFLGLYIYNSGSITKPFGKITVKNGKFVTTTKGHAPVCLDGGASVTKAVNYSVDFENVRFAVAKSNDVLSGALRTWQSKGTANLNLDVKMTDCIFDYTGANTNAEMLSLSYNSDKKSVFNVTIEGGEIIAGSNNAFKFVVNDTSDTITYAKSTDGEYIKLALDKNTAAPSTDTVYTIDSGIECVFVKASETDKNVNYSLYPKVLCGYKIQTSVTLYSNLIYNIYIPVTALNSYTLNVEDYEQSSETKTFNGVEYYCIAVNLPAGKALSDIKLKVTLGSGSKTVDANWTLNVLKYTGSIINGSYNTITKTLMKDMLVYAKAAHDYFDNALDSTKADKVEELLAGYTKEMPTGDAKKPTNKTYFTDVAVYVGEVPSFRFYLASGYTAADFTFTVGGNAVDVKEENGYVEIAMYAYRMLDDVTFTVKSTGVSESYNLYSYYAFATDPNNTDSTAELVAIVEGLMKYSASAKAYRAAYIAANPNA